MEWESKISNEVVNTSVMIINNESDDGVIRLTDDKGNVFIPAWVKAWRGIKWTSQDWIDSSAHCIITIQVFYSFSTYNIKNLNFWEDMPRANPQNTSMSKDVWSLTFDLKINICYLLFMEYFTCTKLSACPWHCSWDTDCTTLNLYRPCSEFDFCQKHDRGS